MIVLGIESTAHTFGIGIASDEKPHILAERRKTYIPKEGGMLPREAARHHSENASTVLREAIQEAKVTLRDIDGIAVSLGPGLGPCLRTGATLARALSLKLDKPLVGVNHSVAHIEIGYLTTNPNDPVILYVSGGNTAILIPKSKKFRVFGETLDIPIGNALDVFAREAGLGPPYVIDGIHVVDKCASEGKEFVNLPYIVKGQDLSYSGLLTASVRSLKKYRKEDVCLSFREIAYDMLVEAAERALSQSKKNELMVVGGVAASGVLREKLEIMMRERGGEVKVVPQRFATDNGAMIAWTGLVYLKHGIRTKLEDSYVRPMWRVDEVDVPWRD
jgi:N6-L-threonylcarbamoyladenine synthase